VYWKGTWRNQYGSTLTITDDANDRIVGVFATALKDSGFYGADVPVAGVHRGDCISFAFAHTGPAGDVICSFTGLLRDGKIETLWHVIRDAALQTSSDSGEPARIEKLSWAHAALTNADTFEPAG
jgi:hypothetical protein